MGTYNVNGRRPPANLDLRPWLDLSTHQADIVAVGIQEVVPLNAGNVVMGMLLMSLWLPWVCHMVCHSPSPHLPLTFPSPCTHLPLICHHASDHTSTSSGLLLTDHAICTDMSSQQCLAIYTPVWFCTNICTYYLAAYMFPTVTQLTKSALDW